MRSSHGSSPTVAIDIVASRRLLLGAAAVLGGAWLACALVALAGHPWRGILAAAALAVAVRPLRLLLGMSPESVRRLRWSSSGEWRIQLCRGGWHRACLARAATLTGGIVLLLGEARVQAARWAALLTALATLAFSIPLYLGFDGASAG